MSDTALIIILLFAGIGALAWVIRLCGREEPKAGPRTPEDDFIDRYWF